MLNPKRNGDGDDLSAEGVRALLYEISADAHYMVETKVTRIEQH